jgi:pseudouridine-5'-phosphate glycosidase
MRGQDALDGPWSGSGPRQEAGTTQSALIVANPVPEDEQLDPALHDRVLADALAAADREQVSGQASTPFLLDYLVRHTDGASLEANLAAVRGNVRLAAQIAACWVENP